MTKPPECWLSSRLPLRFDRFMRAALYDPTEGYYTRGAGIGRDFATSPEIHPLFGALIGVQLHDCWSLLGEPATFDAVEVGGGRGTLAKDVLCWAQAETPRFFEALRYRIVETSAGLRAVQRGALKGLPVRWGWTRGRVRGVVFNNELFDALPVRTFRWLRGQWREGWVGERLGRAELLYCRPATALAATRLRRISLPVEGTTMELAFEAEAMVRRIARRLEFGWHLAIDYGFASSVQGLRSRPAGRVQAHRAQALVANVAEQPGQTDLSAFVDFASLAAAGEAAGLRTLGLVTQRTALRRLEADRRIDAAERSQAAQPPARSRARELIAPAGLGGFLVLAQSAGGASSELAMLREKS